MAAIAYHVAQSFTQGRADRAGAFISTGRELLSYGLRIAHWAEGQIVIDLPADYRPSVTTARHISACRGTLPGMAA